MDLPTNDAFRNWSRRSLFAGLVAVCACAWFAWQDPTNFWRAYLYAFIVVWLMTVGAAGLLALGNLTGGAWAAAGRPYYCAMMQMLPAVAVLFIPIALNLDAIYPWASASSAVSFDFPISKEEYLSKPFFVARAVAYFAIWLVVAWLLGRVLRWDIAPAETLAMRRVGALSLVVLAPTATFAAFDWGMSLEPEWYSSIYGALCTAAGVLAAHSLAVLGRAATSAPIVSPVATTTAGQGGHSHAAGPHGEGDPADVSNDMGNLTLAFVMVWAYFAFSQFLIIWSANLPTEITWYQRRLTDGWQFVALAILLLNFVAPFLMLLSRDLKRDPRRLGRVALLLLATYAVQIYWTVAPAFRPSSVLTHAAALAALVAFGGCWFAAATWRAAGCVSSAEAAGGRH